MSYERGKCNKIQLDAWTRKMECEDGHKFPHLASTSPINKDWQQLSEPTDKFYKELSSADLQYIILGSLYNIVRVALYPRAPNLDQRLRN